MLGLGLGGGVGRYDVVSGFGFVVWETEAPVLNLKYGFRGWVWGRWWKGLRGACRGWVLKNR